jgi:WhiB family transcriptional regulator, redox-sensing transcriptional regulator
MDAWREPSEDAGWSWRTRAACREVDSTVFFAPDGEPGPKQAAREARAKAICARCPVVRQCATYAIWSGERYGVWGGLSERERVAFRLRPDRLLAALPGDRSGPSTWGQACP